MGNHDPYSDNTDINGTIHRVDHACEFGENAVTRGVSEPPAVLFDVRIDSLAIRRKCAQRRLVVPAP
jgi:hypothetical protein